MSLLNNLSKKYKVESKIEKKANLATKTTGVQNAVIWYKVRYRSGDGKWEYIVSLTGGGWRSGHGTSHERYASGRNPEVSTESAKAYNFKDLDEAKSYFAFFKKHHYVPIEFQILQGTKVVYHNRSH